MGDYSSNEVADCIAAYHAADTDESSGTPCSQSPSTLCPRSPGTPQSPVAGHFADYNSDLQLDYPSVGGSSWFDASEEGLYGVFNHHLVEETQSVEILPLLPVTSSLSMSLLPAKAPLSVPRSTEDLSNWFLCHFTQCGAAFPSRNCLYKHLRESVHYSLETPIGLTTSEAKVVKP